MFMQRALLRSIISHKSGKKEITNLTDNFSLVQKSKISLALDTHAEIYAYISKHCAKFTEVPSLDRIKKNFEENIEITDELVKISQESCLFSSNFKSLVEDIYEEQKKREMVDLFKDANQISESGKKVNGAFVSGTKEAMEYLLTNSAKFVTTEGDTKSSGSLKGESHESIKEYRKRKKENKFDGLLTGLPSIDRVCKGVRPGELCLIVAFVSELKTTMCLNFAYTQAIEQGAYVKFISLEMPYKVVRDILICLHSANLNLWPGSEWDSVYPLNFDDIIEGTLNEREEEFYGFLCEDLDKNPEYGDVHIYQPSDGLSFSHLKIWAETEFRKKPFQSIYLDYIELMESEGKASEYTLELNQRIKNLKQLALNFNDKKGIAIFSAYQANRKGKELADKNDGEYRLDALSYANEAERSADLIISSYLNDELRANNQNRVCCLKNRSKPKFRPFNGKTYLPARKIFEDPMVSGTEDGTVNMAKKNQDKKISDEELVSKIL